MGNKKQPVEATKRKKKGRPSLLDLQKRSLRLQKQQQGQQQKQQPSNRNPKPNPISTPQNPNPYLKFPSRRSTRRNPSPNFVEEAAAAEEDDEEEEEEEEDSNGKRKEKKLKLVLRIPNGSEDLDGSESESEGGSRKKRRIDSVETARQNSNAKATDEAPQGDATVLGPTTALPDKKLLVFILDRLQKKDTYGVFSEPVDPEELPDYHEIIENPMDFGSVRKKLDSGAYENLEQFESDVFLISSNAMRYNAPDTIYFRQARSIQELAKKDFENLRSESDDNEQETKTVRRGRPPIKNVMKRIGRPPTDRTGSDFTSDATLANAKDGNHNSNSARDVSRKGSSFDKPTIVDAHKGNNQHVSERNEEYSGSLLKGIPVRNWKKFAALDDNRRSTYNQPLLPMGFQEPSVLTAFDGQRKLLMPADQECYFKRDYRDQVGAKTRAIEETIQLKVGLYVEHAYARSLARFAANLGPIAWEIAAKRIESVLPPGTKFGPGWIGENDASNQFHPVTTSARSSSEAKPSQSNAVSGDDKTPKSHKATLSNSTLPSSGSASVTTTINRPVESVYSTETGRLVNHEGKFGLLGGGTRPKSPLQLRQKSALQHPANGFNQGYGFNLPSQAAKMAQHTRSPEVAMTHCNALDMVSRSSSNSSFNNHQTPTPFTQFGPDDKVLSVVGNSNTMNSRSSLTDSNRTSKGQLRGTSLKAKPSSIPQDLNGDFHSRGSPIDSKQQQQQQPDLALQL